MRKLGLLEINSSKVTQLEVANSNPGILIPMDIHIIYFSSLPLKDENNIQNDGPGPYVYSHETYRRIW